MRHSIKFEQIPSFTVLQAVTWWYEFFLLRSYLLECIDHGRRIVDREGNLTGGIMFNLEVQCITPSHILLASMGSHGVNLPVRESWKWSLPLWPPSMQKTTTTTTKKKGSVNSNNWQDHLQMCCSLCLYLNILYWFGPFKELFIGQPIGFYNPDHSLMAKISRMWCMNTHTHIHPLSLSHC